MGLSVLRLHTDSLASARSDRDDLDQETAARYSATGSLGRLTALLNFGDTHDLNHMGYLPKQLSYQEKTPLFWGKEFA
jgi:hypothetical protein